MGICESLVYNTLSVDVCQCKCQCVWKCVLGCERTCVYLSVAHTFQWRRQQSKVWTSHFAPLSLSVLPGDTGNLLGRSHREDQIRSRMETAQTGTQTLESNLSCYYGYMWFSKRKSHLGRQGLWRAKVLWTGTCTCIE